MGNGQWAMASQPASQWEIWRSGGRFPAVRARLPQGPKCKRSRKTHIEATFGDPGSNPESTRNRFKIDPKSTQGPPGAPGGSARAIPDAFSGPRPPPEAYRAPPGVPKSASENAVVSPGGAPGRSRERLGRVGNARRAPRGQFSARLATQEARSGGPERFWYDFRSISDRFSDCLSSSFDAAGGVVA